MKYFLKTLLFAILFLISGNSVYAMQNQTVLPLVIDKTLEARDIKTEEITITNKESYPMTIYPTVNNISITEGGTIQEFIAPSGSDRTASLASWLEISRLGIDLRPGESKTITLTIRMAPNPVPGTYHAFVGFPSGGNRDEAESVVRNGGAPGTMVTVTIDDTKKEFLKLSKFIVDRFVTKTDNQAAVFTFTNPGDESIVPEGEIIFYNTTGNEVGSIPINEERKRISPGEEFSFTSAVPVTGLFGKYKAFLSVEYGSKQRASLQDTNFFYVFPIKIIGIILSILIVFVSIMAWHFHRRYFDVTVDDSDRLTMHVREGTREAKEHDIDLKKST